MKNLKLIITSILACCTVIFVSCDDDDDKISFAQPISGDYEGSEACDGDTVGPYQVHIYNTSTDNNVVWVENIWDYAPKIKANVSGNSFTLIPQQVIVEGPRPALNDTFDIVSGKGTVEGRNITFDFVLDYHGSPVNCRFSGAKF